MRITVSCAKVEILHIIAILVHGHQFQLLLLLLLLLRPPPPWYAAQMPKLSARDLSMNMLGYVVPISIRNGIKICTLKLKCKLAAPCLGRHAMR